MSPIKKSGFPLGKWVSRQRQNNADLSQERRQKLTELGFVRDPIEAEWDEALVL